MSEHDEQVLFFDWVRINKQLTRNPELRTALELCYAYPAAGKRFKKTANDLRAEGQAAGIPDIALEVPVNGTPGMKIEMKFGKNTLTTHQKEKKLYYEGYGFRYDVCYSGTEAIAAVIDYLPFKLKEYIGV